MKLPEPYPYQRIGAAYLAARDRALLADDMGLGKSAQVLLAIGKLGLTKTLVICPASVQAVWRHEGKTWLDPYQPLPEIMSYERATKHAEHLAKIRWEAVILDESHYVKNPSSMRARAISRIVQSSRRLWCLSGTPMPNGRPDELWTLFRWFGLTDLDIDEYVERFHDMPTMLRGGPNQLTRDPERRGELKAMISACTLRRTKGQVALELPPISFHSTPVESSEFDLAWSPKLAAKFGSVASLMEVIEEQSDRAFQVLTDGNFEALAAEAKGLSTLRLYLGLQKVKNTADMVSHELSLGLYRKIVLFAYHRDVIAALVHLLGREWWVESITGSTSLPKRESAVEAFQKDPECRIMIGQTTAAGTGITLTASHQVFVVESPWDAGALAQAVNRCHRIGTTEPVTVRTAFIPESLDQVVSRVLYRKIRDLLVLELASP